jgi:Universal stress protein family
MRGMGDAPRALAEVAQSEQADLMVVGQSAKMPHRLVGSVSRRLVLKHDSPVIVIVHWGVGRPTGIEATPPPEIANPAGLTGLIQGEHTEIPRDRFCILTSGASASTTRCSFVMMPTSSGSLPGSQPTIPPPMP